MASNPFDELIAKVDGDAKARILGNDFKSFSIDEVLAKLEDRERFPGYVDPRHCLVFWARPTLAVRKLALAVQAKLREAFPNIWLMPEDCMHMTALEVTHSKTREEIQDIVSASQAAFAGIANHTVEHRTRLVKPLLGFDSTAIALSYLPAAGEHSLAAAEHRDSYTYHHLRRDMFKKCSDAGIIVQSRYVALSAHLTMARVINQKDFVLDGTDELDSLKVQRFISVIEEINDWLQAEYWFDEAGNINADGEWLVGQERGVTVRSGTLWYGGGQSLYEGLPY